MEDNILSPSLSLLWCENIHIYIFFSYATTCGAEGYVSGLQDARKEKFGVHVFNSLYFTEKKNFKSEIT